MSTTPKDLTKEAPVAAGYRVGGYVILGRLADKARAEFLGGNVGEFHTSCPLDHMLLDWKGVGFNEIKQEIVGGADDKALATFLDSHGTPKTSEEVVTWSAGMDEMNPYYVPEKKDWFAGACAEVGLDPAKTTLFQYLDADDKTIGKK